MANEFSTFWQRNRRRNSIILLFAMIGLVLYWLGAFQPQRTTPLAKQNDRQSTFQARLKVEIDQTTHWQPRGGEVRFRVESLGDTAFNLGSLDVSVNFRWSRVTPRDEWFHSPAVRVVERPDLKSVVLAAVVPDMADAPPHRILEIGGDLEGIGTFFGLVPQADMWIVAKTTFGSEPAPVTVEEFRTIGITKPAIALLAAIVAVLALVQFLRLFKPPDLRGTNIILQLVETRGRHASLSQFQVVLWTLLIGGATVYVITLSGNLIPISSQALVLLGISGAATLGSQLAPPPPPPAHRGRTESPRWGDLVSDQGQLDVTRVQMLFFTVLVAAFVMVHVVDNYQIPAVPESFLTLVGISNGVYIVNKFIRPGVPTREEATAKIEAAGYRLTGPLQPSEGGGWSGPAEHGGANFQITVARTGAVTAAAASPES